MSLALAELLVGAMAVYIAIGALVALVTVTVGAPRIDPAARGMPIQARMLIFPGAMLLWPIMLIKLVTQKAPPVS
ncbi:MAG: hypothetical protein AAFR41_07330 [Pseudomonadota bacterium]